MTEQQQDVKKDHLPPEDESFTEAEYGDGFPQDDTGNAADINLTDDSRPFDSGVKRTSR